MPGENMSETVGDFDLDFPGFFRWRSFKIKERFLGLGIFLGLQSADIFQIIGIICNISNSRPAHIFLLIV